MIAQVTVFLRRSRVKVASQAAPCGDSYSVCVGGVVGVIVVLIRCSAGVGG